MVPKTDITKAVETLQQDMGRIDTLEKRMEEMRQQSVLDRLEQYMNELELAKQRSEEIVIGSVKLAHRGNQKEDEEPGSASNTGQDRTPTNKPTQIKDAEKKEETTPGGASTRKSWADRNEPLTRKIEIPVFDGENAESWVLRVEQYFELGSFTEEEKLRAVRMCFDDETLMWYRWERERNPFLNWEQVKYRVLDQFTTTSNTSAGERLLTLRQEGTVREYCKEFIAIASNAPKLSKEVLEMVFRKMSRKSY